MKLADLIADVRLDPRSAAIEIAGVTSDSRKVKPGFLFVAIAGAKADGAHFAKQAAANGAAAIVAEQSVDGLPAGAAFVHVANARHALSIAAAKFYARQPKTIVAVTGT